MARLNASGAILGCAENGNHYSDMSVRKSMPIRTRVYFLSYSIETNY